MYFVEGNLEKGSCSSIGFDYCAMKVKAGVGSDSIGRFVLFTAMLILKTINGSN